MTPLALSGGCQASEMVCLVMSLAWMEVTGEGAGDTMKERQKGEEKKEFSPPLLPSSPCCSSALDSQRCASADFPRHFPAAGKVKQFGPGHQKKNSILLGLQASIRSVIRPSSQIVNLPKLKRNSTSELMAGINKTNPISTQLTLTSQSLFLRAGKIIFNFVFSRSPWESRSLPPKAPNEHQAFPPLLFFSLFFSSREQINWFSLKLQ